MSTFDKLGCRTGAILPNNHGSAVEPEFPGIYSTIPTLTNIGSHYNAPSPSNRQNKIGADPIGQAPIPWNIYGISCFSGQSHYHCFIVVVLALRQACAAFGTPWAGKCDTWHTTIAFIAVDYAKIAVRSKSLYHAIVRHKFFLSNTLSAVLRLQTQQPSKV